MIIRYYHNYINNKYYINELCNMYILFIRMFFKQDTVLFEYYIKDLYVGHQKALFELIITITILIHYSNTIVSLNVIRNNV